MLEVACFNADGSMATMCGNALRCVAWTAECDQGFRTMQLRMAGLMHEAGVDTDSAWVTAEAGAIHPRVLQTVINGRPTWFDSAHTGTEHVVGVVVIATMRGLVAKREVTVHNLAGEPFTVRPHDGHPNRAAWVGGPVTQPSKGYSHDPLSRPQPKARGVQGHRGTPYVGATGGASASPSSKGRCPLKTGVPYCGSGVAAPAVAADKILCERVMLTLGVPTPGWRVWSGGPANWAGQAVMVKPPFGGSSVGMSLVRDADDLPRALAEAAGESDEEVLVEDYVIGTP
ncbi:hypothetical protein ACGFYP_02760 [Streptomyces sp. NPDC048370]|uniref:hypothetical protein n=1 Tax=Streptomyces sp. NPDC048370 TaxID=3365540 RepID=UPI0037174AE1